VGQKGPTSQFLRKESSLVVQTDQAFLPIVPGIIHTCTISAEEVAEVIPEQTLSPQESSESALKVQRTGGHGDGTQMKAGIWVKERWRREILDCIFADSKRTGRKTTEQEKMQNFPSFHGSQCYHHSLRYYYDYGNHKYYFGNQDCIL